MPLTFIDIERRTGWRILVLFFVLVFLYFAICIALAVPFLPHVVVLSSGAGHTRMFILLFALGVAAIHFLVSGYNAVGNVVRALDAQPPDPKDEVHAMFLNILREIHVVTGNKRRIQGVVIPTLSLNALAVADLKGTAVIGITEGLLSRLTRPQIETVVAHEANHVLSGDCLETTIAASLFGSLSSLLDRFTESSSGRIAPPPMIWPAWLLLKLSLLLNLFISREREYRSDAASVRMTRNPVALAETLHLLSRSWRGSGFIGSGFEMICIVNPQATSLDEREGFWADLLSTHPPIRKRMDILLKMAHTNIAELDAKASGRERAKAEADARTGPQYYAMDPRQQWRGPFTMGELGALPWFSPLTWVTAGEKQPVERAWKQPLLNAIFAAKLSGQPQDASDYICPSCSQPLVVETYGSTQVYECRYCAGTLVENSKITRIIARTDRERPCSERINALARAAENENQMRHTRRMLTGRKAPVTLLPCPKCKNPMVRGFYSLAYLIDVDRCGYCGITWFDKDELAMLQCLIENKVVPDIGAETPAS